MNKHRVQISHLKMAYDISQRELDEYYELVRKYTDTCDSAHDMSHLQHVAYEANKIADTLFAPNTFQTLIYACSLGHELLDQKQACYDETELLSLLKTIFSSDRVASLITFIAKTVSYSKVSKWKRDGHDFTKDACPFWILIRTCVSDADMLDGVGRDTDEAENTCTGLNRMLDYRRSNVALMNDKPLLIKEINQHLDDKFRRVLKDDHLITKYARKKYAVWLEKLESAFNEFAAKA